MIENIRKKSIFPFFILLTGAFIIQILNFIHRSQYFGLLNVASLPLTVFFSGLFLMSVYANFGGAKGTRNKFNYLTSLMLIFSTVAASLLYFVHKFFNPFHFLSFPAISFAFQGVVIGTGILSAYALYRSSYRNIREYVRTHGYAPPPSKTISMLSVFSILSIMHTCVTFLFKESEALVLSHPSLWITITLMAVCVLLFLYMAHSPYSSKDNQEIESNTDNEEARLSLTSTTIPSELYNTVHLTFENRSEKNSSTDAQSPQTPRRKHKSTHHSTAPSKNDPRYWTDKGKRDTPKKHTIVNEEWPVIVVDPVQKK